MKSATRRLLCDCDISVVKILLSISVVVSKLDLSVVTVVNSLGKSVVIPLVVVLVNAWGVVVLISLNSGSILKTSGLNVDCDKSLAEIMFTLSGLTVKFSSRPRFFSCSVTVVGATESVVVKSLNAVVDSALLFTVVGRVLVTGIIVGIESVRILLMGV